MNVILKTLSNLFRNKPRKIVICKDGHEYIKSKVNLIVKIPGTKVIDFNKSDYPLFGVDIRRKMASVFGKCNRVYYGKKDHSIWVFWYREEEYQVWASSTGVLITGVGSSKTDNSTILHNEFMNGINDLIKDS